LSKVLDAAPTTPVEVAKPAEQAPATPTLSERLAKATPEERRAWETERKLPEQKPEDLKPAATPEGEAPKPAPEKEPEKKEQDRRPSWRAQRKIGALEAETKRLQRELDEVRKTSPSSKEQPAAIQVSEKMFRDYKINPDDYKTFDGAVIALVEAVAEERLQKGLTEHLSKREQAQQEAAQKANEEKWAKDWYKEGQSFIKDHADFQEKFDTLVEAFGDRQTIGDAIVNDEHSHQLVYQIASNDELLSELLDMPDTQAIKRIGKLSAALDNQPVPKKTTSAPTPPRSDGGRDPISEGPKPGSREWERQLLERTIKRRELL
jgi:hypothetical protein